MLAVRMLDKIFMTEDFYSSSTLSFNTITTTNNKESCLTLYGYDVIISDNPIRDACFYKVKMDNKYY